MKSSYTVIIIFILLSCGKADDTPETGAFGEVSYKINDLEQTTTNVALKLDVSPNSKLCDGEHFTLTIDNPESRLKTRSNAYETLYFDKLTLEAGKRQVGATRCENGPQVGVALFSSAGDVLYASYKLIGNEEENWIEIASYDELSKTLTGEFNLNFAVEKEHPDNPVPDTVHFTNGRIVAVLQN
ncbi:hypothetical protein [uncultured Imperialibacter sp.]|uniref:hypothetical protein n=1 Tax=uncultured Imperialibacter sp. TaxID=1672639 RepID=UPI0030DA27AC|tara:strand:- start:22836 stop:23390 length:555 start_codon:yes stop_codon:yes gene_type:complete